MPKRGPVALTREEKERLFPRKVKAAPVAPVEAQPQILRTAQDDKAVGAAVIEPKASRLHADGSKHVNKSQRTKELVLMLAEQQEWKCFWCGEQMTNDNPKDPNYRTLEHILAKAVPRKGVEELPNLRAACKFCNDLRGQFNTAYFWKEIERLTDQLTTAQKTIARHRVTMAGRCLYCKARFYWKEWMYKNGLRDRILKVWRKLGWSRKR